MWLGSLGKCACNVTLCNIRLPLAWLTPPICTRCSSPFVGVRSHWNTSELCEFVYLLISIFLSGFPAACVTRGKCWASPTWCDSDKIAQKQANKMNFANILLFLAAIWVFLPPFQVSRLGLSNSFPLRDFCFLELLTRVFAEIDASPPWCARRPRRLVGEARPDEDLESCRSGKGVKSCPGSKSYTRALESKVSAPSQKVKEFTRFEGSAADESWGRGPRSVSVFSREIMTSTPRHKTNTSRKKTSNGINFAWIHAGPVFALVRIQEKL